VPQSSHLIGRSAGRDAAIACVLILITIALYFPVRNYRFLEYDDKAYVANNRRVQAGITWDSLRWASTAVVAANWHPVTLFSHMLDCQLFGAKASDAGMHHLTNAALHAANVGLLFLVMLRMTGQPWPSATVAALFGWHPLRVESVAWIAERKDVLSLFFFLLAIWAYTGYVARRSIGRYSLVCLLHALALLSKPMMVTFPFVLLLLDYWPLGRFVCDRWTTTAPWKLVARRVWEKLPLLALSAGSSVATVVAQRSVGAVWEQMSPSLRWINLAMAVPDYIGKTLWPHPLAIPYLLIERDTSATAMFVACLAAVGLVLACLAALVAARTRPYVPVGWFWFIGTLVPVIGLVQVGPQAIADRYTYLPSIGLAILVAWGVPDAIPATWRYRRALLASGALLCLVALVVVTRSQLRYWRDTKTLFTHSLRVSDRNFIAYTILGGLLEDEGKNKDAIAAYDRALRIMPRFDRAHLGKGQALLNLAMFDEAAVHLYQSLRREGEQVTKHIYLAETLSLMGRMQDARDHYSRALEMDPTAVDSLENWSPALSKTRRTDEAIDRYRQALVADPENPVLAMRLAWIYATDPDSAYRNGGEAVRLAAQACRAARDASPLALDALAAACAESGEYDKAARTARRAIARAAEFGRRDADWRDLAEEMRSRLALYEAEKPYRHDPQQHALRLFPFPVRSDR